MKRSKSTSRKFDVEAFIDDRIGIRHLAHGKHGSEFVCDCPFCNGKAKFWCNAKTGTWICYRCGEAGGVLKLIALQDDITISEARKILAGEEDRGRLATPMDEIADRLRAAGTADLEPAGPTVPDSVPLPDEFVPIWNERDRLWSIPPYLDDRKISARTAAIFGLGFCLTGKYHHRLIFPARMDGLIRYWQGRAMVPIEPKYHGPAEGKGSALFGYDESVGAEQVVLVEGPIDALSLHQKGWPVIAAMGRTISAAQVVAIARGGFRRVIVMWDPPGKDGAGNEASPDAAADTIGEVAEAVVAIPTGDLDPGDAPAEAIGSWIAAARPPSFAARFRSRLASRP